MTYYETNEYKAQHAGWLLACCAESNVAKGQRIYNKLPPEHQVAACMKRDDCLEAYAKGEE
jgi:hypothetical protein